MKDNCKIGVFDSGIGGVTVLKEIVKILPNEQYIYYSDSKNNPYGDKNQKEIIEICDKIVEKLVAKGCKAIVIACNTASAEASEFLRNKYKDIPIIAIEPAYKMVHDFAYNDTTLVMATKGTTESENFEKLIEKYDNNKTYILPCIGLANSIENGNENQIEKCLINELEPYKGKVKNVVLGCTHYPLIKKQISDILGEVRFFDGAPSLARHLKNILIEKNLIEEKNTNYNEDINSSKDKNEIEVAKEKTLEDDYDNVSKKCKLSIEFIDSSNEEVKEKRFFEILKIK